ncbi:hypothetical protein IMSAGC011_01521 [Lachnospiraceae bacterium]|nr:hypothetical protein IMSAGC011_01521 [Lachnospiraceae bacterium]
MQKLNGLKRNIVVCLIVGMLAGGMGVRSYAAEVVGEQIVEQISTNDIDGTIIDGSYVLKSRNVRCTVEKNGNVTYTAAFHNTLPVSDDGLLYLFELAPYEYDIKEGTKVIDYKNIEQFGSQLSFTFPVNFRQPDTRLYSKFAIGIKSGGVIYMVTEPTYITNPEALAWNTLARSSRNKKSTQGEEFNNIFMDGTFGPQVAGKFKTLQVLNTGDSKALTHPMARKDAQRTDLKKIRKPMYYMFNASDEEGVKALATTMEYYVANSKGGENWIIGNEVNTRLWNYMAWTDWNTYIKEYTQVFRVMYNAIMSTNANARVYVCIDQIWDRNLTPSEKEYYQFIDGKDFLEKFQGLIKLEGDIGWGVAQHPYTNPMGYAKFWDMSGCKNGNIYAAQVAAGEIVTFQNLSVLTDFMKTPTMLDANGNVRHIILSEIGLSNKQGSEIQAAALCASYAAVVDNPYIDEIIYLPAYSDPGMDASLDGFSQSIYNEMDGVNSMQYLEWAKSYIGVHDWSEIIW